MINMCRPGINLAPYYGWPALAHAFVREPVMGLSNSRPIAKRVADKVPVDLAGVLRQFVLHIDNLIQPRSE